MFDEKTIESQIRLGEDSRNEFIGVALSRHLTDADDLARKIAGFANSGGGRIFLGVENDGAPTGVGTLKQADKLMLQISHVCLDNILPPLGCAQTKVEFKGALLLVVEIPAFSPDRPFKAKVGKREDYFIRDGTQTQVASQAALKRIFQSFNFNFDEQGVPDAAREELDPQAIARSLDAIYGPGWERGKEDYYLRTLKWLDLQYHPTVSGILFAGRDPTRWFPDARISAVRCPGTSITGTFADRDEIKGLIPEQIESAIAFLSRHLNSASHVEGRDRVDIRGPGSIPLEALREALLNAVAHRDYRVASQVRIFVLDDRIEIVNPGELLNQLTLDNIRIPGIKQHRNPVIASLLMRLMTARRESLEIGVPEMIRLMKEKGLPEPGFDIQGSHFRIILKSRPEGAP